MYDVKLINNNVETYINVTSTEQNAPRIIGSIKQGINVIDSFTFDIYPNNPGYTEICPLKTRVEVENSLTGRVDPILSRAAHLRDFLHSIHTLPFTSRKNCYCSVLPASAVL